MDLWVAKDRTLSNHWDDPNSEYCWFFGIRMRTACLVIILYTHNTLCIYIVINMCVYIYVCIHTCIPYRFLFQLRLNPFGFPTLCSWPGPPDHQVPLAPTAESEAGVMGSPTDFGGKNVGHPTISSYFLGNIYIYISSRISTWLSYFFPDINIYIYINHWMVYPGKCCWLCWMLKTIIHFCWVVT